MTLPQRCNYYWRLAATGFCFLIFGPGACLAVIALLPLRLLPYSEDQKQQLARRLIRHFFGFYIWLMEVSGPLSLSIQGEEKLANRRGKLIIANHPTLIDAVVLISRIPDVICIAKSELNQSFFLRELLRVTGYITNSEPELFLRTCRENLAKGKTLLMFPEGTRSVPGQPLRFLRGAAQIALRSNCALVPVLITCKPPSLMKGQPWYEVPKQGPVRLKLEVLEDIDPGEHRSQNEGISLASRKLTRYLTEYFQVQLQREDNGELSTRN